MFRRIKDFIWNIKDKFYLLKHGYSKSNIWSIDYYLQDTFPKMIIDLRNRTFGYNNDVSFDDIKNYSIEFVEEAMKEIEKINKDKDFEEPDIFDGFTQWLLILSRIAYCFKMSNDENHINEFEDAYFEDFNWHFENVPDKNGLYEMKIERTEDEELEKNYTKRVAEINDECIEMKNEAFVLLNRWFYNLWY